ncbi:MAG: hypothetical protein ACRCV9_01945 [Burkholderiaceae bacterium]
MTTTARALIFGTTLALTGLALLQAFVPAPVAAEPQIVKLEQVIVTASRAQAAATQLDEAIKQASASLRKGG